jgi:hypothetical protein
MVDQGNSNSNPHLGPSHSNNANQANQTAIIDQAVQIAAAQLAQQILNITKDTLKQEVIKIPEFYGQTNKDTISAMDFISRVDKCQISKDWNDITTFANFRLCLRGEAERWLTSTIRHLCLMPEQKTWTRIRPLFKREFAAISDDKLIADGLANLSHRPNENPRALFSRLEKLLFVLKENYASYQIKPERPAQQPQGGYSEDALTKYGNECITYFSNFLFAQMFRAAAPENVRHLISHKDQTRLTVDDAYHIFQSEARVEADKKISAAEAVSKETTLQSNNQEIAAFSPQQKHPQRGGGQQGQSGYRGNRSRGQNSYCSNNSGNRKNSGPGSYNSRNGKFCIFCKIMGHCQQECWKRIRENKPCVDMKGQTFWPKLNAAAENANSMQAQKDPNDGVGSVFH